MLGSVCVRVSCTQFSVLSRARLFAYRMLSGLLQVAMPMHIRIHVCTLQHLVFIYVICLLSWFIRSLHVVRLLSTESASRPAAALLWLMT